MEKSPSGNVEPIKAASIPVNESEAFSKNDEAQNYPEAYNIATSPCYKTMQSDQPVTPARTGRNNSRYEENTGYRLCCMTVPYCIDQKAKAGKQTKILLVTRRNKKGWKFPGGGWEIDETREQCAMRELLEESGCTGRVTKFSHDALHFSESKNKIAARYYWHTVEITSIYEKWAEGSVRFRKVVTLDEVESHLGTEELREQWKILSQSIPAM